MIYCFNFGVIQSTDVQKQFFFVRIIFFYKWLFDFLGSSSFLLLLFAIDWAKLTLRWWLIHDIDSDLIDYWSEVE